MATSEARKAYQKAYYEANKDRLLAAQRERGRRNYQANQDAYKARSAAWKAANPEKMKELQKRYALANSEKMNQRSRDWYLNNKERASARSRVQKLKAYGLTESCYQAMLESQSHKCAICGSANGMQQGKARLYVDHCHSTGKVRGLLCQKCNVGLGMFSDNLKLLEAAHRYLTKSLSGAT